MSRATAGDVIVVKPENDIYTALAIVGFLAQLLTFVIVYLKYKALFGADLFQA